MLTAQTTYGSYNSYGALDAMTFISLLGAQIKLSDFDT